MPNQAGISQPQERKDLLCRKRERMTKGSPRGPAWVFFVCDFVSKQGCFLFLFFCLPYLMWLHMEVVKRRVYFSLANFS